MTAFVLDSSVAVSWCFDNEINDQTDILLDKLVEYGGYVPLLWYWEVANVLNTAVKKGRIKSADVPVRLRILTGLPVESDDQGVERTMGETLLLAQAERLSVYDAAYLELSLRLGLPLATLDAELRQAAQRRGVEVLP
jgi:predicted nucleic acid-binding protein